MSIYNKDRVMTSKYSNDVAKSPDTICHKWVDTVYPISLGEWKVHHGQAIVKELNWILTGRRLGVLFLRVYTARCTEVNWVSGEVTVWPN